MKGRKQFGFPLVFLLCLIQGSARGQQVVIGIAGGGQPVPAGESLPEGPKLSGLVRIDDRGEEYLLEARGKIKDKKYVEAIGVLHRLIRNPQGGFVPAADEKNRYVSVSFRAARILGELPEEVLAQYRRDFQAEAKQKYTESLEALNVQGLWSVASRFPHTPWAVRSWGSLGDIFFDRGSFLQAATCWGRQLDQLPTSGIESKEPELILTRIATACYLACRKELGDSFRQRVEKDHPEATGTLGGRERKLLEFLGEVRDRKVVASSARMLSDYSGWGGASGWTGSDVRLPGAVASAMEQCENFVRE